MATIKSYTDLEQSKKLVDILPLESADMSYYLWKDDGHLVSPVPFVLDGTEEKENGLFEYIPCWSLTTLLSILPEGTRLLKSSNISSIGDVKYHCDCTKGNTDKWFDNPVDACYEMIIKLNELNLL